MPVSAVFCRVRDYPGRILLHCIALLHSVGASSSRVRSSSRFACVCAVCGDAYFTVVGLKAGGHPVCAPRKHGCSPKPDLRRIAQAFCVYAHAHAHATRRYRALSAAFTPPRRAVPARIGASNPRTERTNNREPHSRGTLLDYLMARGREPSGGGRATSERCRPRTRERVLGGIPRGSGRLRKRPLVSSSP